MEKTCITCGKAMPIEQFYKRPGTIDKYYGKCKSCFIAYTIEYQKQNIEKRKNHQASYRLRNTIKLKEKDQERNRRQERRRYLKKSVDKWIENNPEKHRAHFTLRNAIKSGKISPPPLSCQVCGKEKPLEAHHDDYSKPLDIVWMCSWCHKAKHRKLKVLVTANVADL